MLFLLNVKMLSTQDKFESWQNLNWRVEKDPRQISYRVNTPCRIRLCRYLLFELLSTIWYMILCYLKNLQWALHPTFDWEELKLLNYALQEHIIRGCYTIYQYQRKTTNRLLFNQSIKIKNLYVIRRNKENAESIIRIQ